MICLYETNKSLIPYICEKMETYTCFVGLQCFILKVLLNVFKSEIDKS